jgi:hypothetical protein
MIDKVRELYNKSIMDVQNREYFSCFGNEKDNFIAYI